MRRIADSMSDIRGLRFDVWLRTGAPGFAEIAAHLLLFPALPQGAKLLFQCGDFELRQPSRYVDDSIGDRLVDDHVGNLVCACLGAEKSHDDRAAPLGAE